MDIIRKPTGSGGSSGGAVTTVSTTNATVTTIDTVPIPTNSVLMIKAKVVGIKDDFAMKGGVEVIGVYANKAGTVTLQGATTNVHSYRETGWDVTLVISGTNVLIRVKGAAATNISWKSVRTSVGV